MNVSMLWRTAFIAASLASFSSVARAQEQRPHAEACTHSNWGFLVATGYNFGTINQCTYSVTIWMMTSSGQQVSADVAPGGAFNSGFAQSQFDPGRWVGAVCQTGYRPSLAVTVSNAAALARSEYNCIAAAAAPDAAHGSSPQPLANSAAVDIDPVTLAAAHRFAQSIHLQDSMVRVMEHMVGLTIDPIARAHSLNEAQKNQLEQAVLQEIRSNPGELVAMAENEYARRLSAADLNAIADFYESPAGSHFVAQIPQMQSDLLAVG